MPIGLNDLVEYEVHQTRNGEDIHLWVKHRDDRLPRFHWYPSPEAFTKSGARHFWGVTCGMNEETRDHVVDVVHHNKRDHRGQGTWSTRPTRIIGRISHRARYAVHSRLLLICDSRLLCTRRSAMPKAKRKQLNIGITPDQYEAVRIAAEEEGQTITVYCRSAIMEAAAPEPEIPDVTGLPPWLIHFLLFISRGKTRPAMRIE